MPLTDECRTCEHSKRCNRSDRARGMRCKDYKKYKQKRTYKNEKIRDIIYGKAEILIINGKIDVNVMKKDRYNLDDLISHLHANNIASPLEVKFAILEANGKLTVFKKDSKILWPEPIIKDGKLIQTVVNKLNINLDKFNNELFKRGFNDYKDILICYLLENDLYIQKKMLTNKK